MKKSLGFTKRLLNEFDIELFNNNYDNVYSTLLFNLINPNGVFFTYLERKFQQENKDHEEIYDFSQKVKFLNRNPKIAPVIGIIISMRNKLIHNSPISHNNVKDFLSTMVKLMIGDTSNSEINRLVIVINEIVRRDIPGRILMEREKIIATNLISYINQVNVEVPIDFIQAFEKLYRRLIIDSDDRTRWNLFEWYNYDDPGNLLNNVIELKLSDSMRKGIVTSYDQTNLTIHLKEKSIEIGNLTRFDLLKNYETNFLNWRNEMDEIYLIGRYIMLNSSSPINDIVIFKGWKGNNVEVLQNTNIITLNIHTEFRYISKDPSEAPMSFEEWEATHDRNLLIGEKMLIENESIVHTFLEWTEHNVILTRANRKRVVSKSTFFRLL